MVRQANPVDFWRGLALVFIFINHIPGIYYSRFTHANYSLSDSADLFVFLAGWALRLMVGTPERRQSTWYLVLRLGGRAHDALCRADHDHHDRDGDAGRRARSCSTIRCCSNGTTPRRCSTIRSRPMSGLR